jgi:transposase InsO family protein
MNKLDKLVEQKAQEILRVKKILFILNYISKSSKSVIQELREFEIPKSTYYKWKKKYDLEGIKGIERKKPIANSHPRSLSQSTIDKILELRKTCNLGPIRITWYLERYYGIKTSESTVSRTLVKHGVSRLPKTASRRTVHTKRYAKKTPGHQVQVDVKFLSFNTSEGKKIKRYQFTAIDDATRIRALKIYEKHTQKNAIDFIEYVIKKFPFRIHTIRTDRGHEFQAQFHWHVEDQGIRHVYIKPRSPQLNGKVERSHRTDQEEFYQLLSYTDDVDLNKKLKHWEQFYNFDRPHGAFQGKTPYETLRSILIS